MAYILGCLTDNPWWIFLATSGAVFVIGLVVLITIHILKRSTRIFSKIGRCGLARFYTQLKGICEGLISGSTIIGRIVISLSCIFSVGSFVIYIIDATTLPDSTDCPSLSESISQQIDLAFNIYFLIYFLLRFVAANDKLKFWVELNSLVDIFTIPPVFVSIVLDQQWLGLRFLRAIRLMNIPDLLQYLRVLTTNNTIRLSQLISILFSVWFAAAGFVHLVENAGGFTEDLDSAQNITYWESVYFIVITMSTVGYGDFYCKTIVGQAFIVVFVFCALAMFASFVPEIAEIFGKQNRYTGGYEKRAGFRHVVLCGHITFDTVDNFVRDFHHQDRGSNAVKSVFLHTAMPDLEMEALLKRHFTNVTYLRGMVTNPKDLNRVKLREADACLIMADPQSNDPDSEDAANIMRLVSVKNFHPEIRVIIQLIRYQNKAFCMNLPFWTSFDQVICLSELKLGFMAAGTLAPGISTLIANLFVMRSYESSSKHPCWQDLYMKGAGMEIYTESFSPAFYSKPFSTVFEICYTQLGLLLVAVTYTTVGPNSTGRNTVILNPDHNFTIDSTMKGFFICQSECEAKQVRYYCPVCHHNRSRKRKSKPCNCKNKTDVDWESSLVSLSELVEKKGRDVKELDSARSPLTEEVLIRVEDSEASKKSELVVGETVAEDGSNELERFESTGTFHWCPATKFEQCILNDKNSPAGSSLEGHVIVCCFANAGTSSISLRNLALPLRASNIPRTELRPIVLVGEEGFLKEQWHQLSIYPYIYVKLGSPLNRAVLRSVSIGQCNMCLILSANTLSAEDSTLCDKESILCSLNIKTMNLLPQTFSDLKRGPNLITQLMGTVSLVVPQHLAPASETGLGGSSITEPRNNIFLLTEIAHDGNAQYLDQDDEDDPDTPLYLTQPFCCGRAFAASVLDSLMSSIYYNPAVLNLIRTLVIGGDPVEMEQILAEGIQLEECSMSSEDLYRIRNRSRISLLHVRSRLLRNYSHETYGKFVLRLHRDVGILCLGVYRVLCSELYGVESHNRFVITNPSDDFQIEPNDKIFCLRPFRISFISNKQESSRRPTEEATIL